MRKLLVLIIFAMGALPNGNLFAATEESNDPQVSEDTVLDYREAVIYGVVEGMVNIVEIGMGTHLKMHGVVNTVFEHPFKRIFCRVEI